MLCETRIRVIPKPKATRPCNFSQSRFSQTNGQQGSSTVQEIGLKLLRFLNEIRTMELRVAESNSNSDTRRLDRNGRWFIPV